MRIGFDAKRFFQNDTGLGNYSRNLVENCARFQPEHEYFLFASKIRQNKQTEFAFTQEHIDIISPKKSNLLWRSIGIKRDIKGNDIDLFHGLSAELPIRLKIPTVVTIHDLIFETHPNQYKLIDQKIYSAKAKYACKSAQKVIAISESTKQDLIQFYGTSPDKIEVVYQSCDDQFYASISETKLSSIRQQYQLPERYILYVGSIIPRKNLLEIVQAIQILRDDLGEIYHLVAIGNQGSDYARQVILEVDRLNLLDQVHFLTDVDFQDLPAIYKNSWLFIYPSDYEGFGIPVLEAQAVGVPVITSNKSSLPEAAGPHSVCLDVVSGYSIAQAISELNANPELRAHMVEQGYVYIKRFDAQNLTNQLISLYQSLI